MALAGIKVVEVSTWAAGPTCGMWLAENGAEVVRVEPVEGDTTRGFEKWGVLPTTDFNWLWELWNRSKRDIALDLHQEAGREIVHKLVRQADVFLANLRPSTLKRATLDYETLSQLNSRLIYANLTGYGTKGGGADWPAFDGLAFWARSGVGANLGEPDEYVSLRGANGDHTTGMFMLGGIALALYARERTGRGQRVDVSLLSSGIWVAGVENQGALTCGVNVPKLARKKCNNPIFNHYQCKDGKWVVFDMLQSDRFWPSFCKALMREDLEHDPRFFSSEKRMENNEELIAIIDEVLATRNRDEWEQQFKDKDIVWQRVQTSGEVIHDPWVLDNNYIVEYEHHIHGKIKGIACPIQLSENPTRVPRAAPEFSQHTEEILLELGYSWDDISKLKDNKVIP